MRSRTFLSGGIAALVLLSGPRRGRCHAHQRPGAPVDPLTPLW
jgi:hypothetical protein